MAKKSEARIAKERRRKADKKRKKLVTIEVDEDDFSKLETISDLVDYIEEY